MSWTDDSEAAIGFSAQELFGFLLLENGGRLLQENGAAIFLDLLTDTSWSDDSALGTSWS